jgi:4-amino-4-deoxy-L-arabinose transferase-like glycosyltransferase
MEGEGVVGLALLLLLLLVVVVVAEVAVVLLLGVVVVLLLLLCLLPLPLLLLQLLHNDLRDASRCIRRTFSPQTIQEHSDVYNHLQPHTPQHWQQHLHD